VLPQTNRYKSVTRARPQFDRTDTRARHWSPRHHYGRWSAHRVSHPTWPGGADRSISRLVVVEEKPNRGPAIPTDRPKALRSLISVADAWIGPVDGRVVSYAMRSLWNSPQLMDPVPSIITLLIMSFHLCGCLITLRFCRMYTV